MIKKFISTASAVLAIFTGVSASPSYFNAITNLNPVGYWPLHEVAAAAPGDIETNYGTLGVLGNAYYTDWASSEGSFQRGYPGALTNDPDPSVYFTIKASNAGGPTNALYVPHASPLTTLIPPFSVESWVLPQATKGTQGDIWSQSGYEGLNAGASGGGAGTVGGIRLYWDGPGFIVYSYYNSSTLNTLGIVTANITTNVWYHLVVTCDASTNVSLYINGNLAFTKAAVGLYTPDYWTAFEIGNGRGNTRAFPSGAIDEVAIYTNVITDIGTHYNDALNGAAGQYFYDVTNDNALLYLRLDSPAYTPPALSTWPVATNYGSVGVNGVYTPGTLPGAVAGPGYQATVFTGFLGFNTTPFNGVSSFADAGYASVYNPTGATPFTITAIFRGNPADNRFQNIIGHSDSSWRIALNTNGKLQATLGTNSSSVVNSVGVYNDGNWHQVVDVYAPNPNPTLPGTNALYVDGVLDSLTNGVSTNGILPGSASDVLIAADPQYTNSPAGAGRQFAGEVCEVALFTNALTASNVLALFNAVQQPPYITGQPQSGTANQGTLYTNSVTVRGSSPLSYQWYTHGIAFAGQTNASLILNPVVGADASTNIQVIVTNNFGSATSAVVSLTVYSSPSIGSQSPVTYTNPFVLFAGTSPSYAVSSLLGAQPITFQWYTNGVPIIWATNSSVTLSNVAAGWLTNYCVAKNFVGSTTSALWIASVVTPPTAPYPQAVLAASPLGYWRLNEPDDGIGDGNAGEIAHDYVGGNDGIYTNTQLGGVYSFGSPGTYSSSDPTETPAEFGDQFVNSVAYGIAGIDFSSPTNTSKAFTIEAWVNGYPQTADAGIVAKGYGNGGEQFDLDTGSDTLATHGFRFFVRDAAGGTHSISSTVTPSLGIWHHLVGVCDEPNGLVTFYIDGQSVGTASISPGTGILSSSYLTAIGSRYSTLAVSAANTYDDQFVGFISDVAIYNYALSASQVVNQYYAAGEPPVITAQPPANVTASLAGTLAVTATAGGTAPLSYQWYDAGAGNAAIFGQTNATLIISNVPANYNNDSVYLVVANGYGTTNTASTSITLASAPQIIASNLLAQLILPAGKSYTYSVTVLGVQPIVYQWYDGAMPIAGQTNSTYTVVNATPGNYSVSATNIDGQITSAISVLTTVAAPAYDYATNILGLNPAGYWPLQETNAPAPVTEETNLGTLGPLGNAYYAIDTANEVKVLFDQGGALTGSGDADPAVEFTGPSGTNYAFVPHSIPALTMQPPLTYEAWINSSSTIFGDIIGEGGNGENSATGAGIFGGIRMSYAGNNSGGPALQAYVYNSSGNNAYNDVSTPANSLVPGNWHHCVMTFDGTNISLYIDGQLQGYGQVPKMSIDTWSPLTIGSARWQGSGSGPTRDFYGVLDEVAVYNYVLSAGRVQAHYVAGTASSGSNYVSAVTNDSPILYYRMDAAGYVSPNPTTFPAAVNFGSAQPNASYDPGVSPAYLAGPPIGNLGTNSVAALQNGVISAIDAGSDASFNPTGNSPFTATAWFKTYPSDARIQTIVSHGGATSWGLNLIGTNGTLAWNSGAGSVASPTVLNDGNWHFAAGVYDGTKNYLYVDGVLTNSSTAAGNIIGNTTDDVLIGGDPDYTIIGINQQYFAGAIAQVALFTNALSAAQIEKIYAASVASATATPTISVSASGRNVVITYTGGTLLSSTNVTGPYSAVSGASSPYTIPATGTQKFYRTSNP